MDGVTEQDIADAHEATGDELYAGGVLSVASVLARCRSELTSDEATLRRAEEIIITRVGECDVYFRDGSAFVGRWPGGGYARASSLAESVAALELGVGS